MSSLPAVRPVSVEIVNGHATTTSLDIAEHFGKRHDTVLRAIRQLDCSPEYHARNFAEMVVEKQIGSGAIRKDPAFRITRDGFTFLAMGFTGAQAARWKEAYIEAFNKLERALVSSVVPSEQNLDRIAWEMCHAMWHEIRKALAHEAMVNGEVSGARVLVSCDVEGRGQAQALHPYDLLVSAEQYEAMAEGLALHMAATRAIEHGLRMSNVVLAKFNKRPEDVARWLDRSHVPLNVRAGELSISQREI